MARVRMVTFNTHVGRSITNGTLRDVVRWGRPDVLFLQELTRPVHAAQVRAVLGPEWLVLGHVDTFVCLRRDAFDFRWALDTPNTHGEKHERYAASCAARHRATGRVFNLQSVHCQPLGRGLLRASLGAVRRQGAQLLTYVEASARRHRRHVVVDAGDFNQNMGSRVRSRSREAFSAHSLWASAGMVAASRLTRPGGDVRLDEFMVRTDPFVKVVRRAVYKTWRRGDDHDAVLLVLDVKPLRRFFRRR